MNSPKTVNTIIIALSLLAALACFGLGGFFLFQEREALSSLIKPYHLPREMLQDRCQDHLKKLNVHVNLMPDGAIRASFYGDIATMEDPKSWFDRFSVAVLACPGYRLDHFCAGRSCKPLPFYMILRESEAS